VFAPDLLISFSFTLYLLYRKQNKKKIMPQLDPLGQAIQSFTICQSHFAILNSKVDLTRKEENNQTTENIHRELVDSINYN